MKFLKIMLLFVFALSFSTRANAETFEFPFKSGSDRQKAAAMLSQDPDFINLLVLNVFQSRLGGDPSAMLKQAIAGQDNLTSDNGMLKNHGPEFAEKERKNDAEMKNEPAGGMVADNPAGMKNGGESIPDLTVPAGEKIAPVALPADPSVENVDFFLSLTCDHCRRFWKTLMSDDILKEHVLDDRLKIRIIPNSTADAGIIIIFETLKEKDKPAARDFLTWYFTEGKNSNEKAMFAGAEKWLAERNLPGLQQIHDDKDLIKRIGDRVEESIALDQKLDAAYPSVFVNGKEDAKYFTTARENILKSLSEKQEKK